MCVYAYCVMICGVLNITNKRIVLQLILTIRHNRQQARGKKEKTTCKYLILAYFSASLPRGSCLGYEQVTFDAWKNKEMGGGGGETKSFF